MATCPDCQIPLGEIVDVKLAGASPAAGPAVRIGAKILDTLMLRTLLFLVLAIVNVSLDTFWWLLGGSIVHWVVAAGLEHRDGATPGKRLLNLRVVSPNGSPSLRSALIRNAYLPFLFLPGPPGTPVPGLSLTAGADRLTLVFLLPITLILAISSKVDPNGQGLHDQLATTKVIRSRRR